MKDDTLSHYTYVCMYTSISGSHAMSMFRRRMFRDKIQFHESSMASSMLNITWPFIHNLQCLGQNHFCKKDLTKEIVIASAMMTPAYCLL